MKYVPSKQTVRERCTSLKSWELPKQESALAPPDVWTNKDMDPVPPEDQTWSLWTWMAYWATDTINLGTWETASSVIAIGLNWRDAIPIMVVGTSCVAIPMVLNGAIGARLHIPFSVIVRSSFGYYLGYFCIVSRSILAMFWLGIQGANGAICITVMISSIWPSYNNIPNRLPDNAGADWSVIGLVLQHIDFVLGITTQGMISYFLFWIIQLPLLLIPPTRLRWLFIVKLFAAPITALATLGWIVHKANGAGDLFDLPETVHGTTRIYVWLSSMSAVTGSWATLACNIPDFSRYAKSSKGQYIQLPFLPIIFTLCGVMGIITTSASYVLYGEYLWNPLQIIQHWQVSHAGRAAAFFAALSWYIAQVGTNITARVIVPWKILSSAETFLNFMGGYSVFLAPIAGIIASDYWLVKRFNIDVPALYNPRGRYRYTWGVNWRAATAFLVPVAPLLPGLGNSIAPIPGLSPGIQHLYTIDWLFGFVTAIFLYTGLSLLFPARESLSSVTIFGHEFDGEYEIERADGEKGYPMEKGGSLEGSNTLEEIHGEPTELKGIEG
ncbi:MAG: hypothetical protein MMC33_003474 [Icmadophila ericetorum]|nr:hypothetical protein [Icmadophila ericetorum]